MRKCFYVFLLMMFCHCKNESKSLAEPKETHHNKADVVTKALDSINAQGVINGFSVAIVNKDSILYAKGFGYSNVKDSKPYTEHTIQNIASISKTLIGVALLKAQELNKLKLDDPINKYLPFEVKNPYFPEEAITLRDLATHTSSIIDSEVYDRESYILFENKGSSDEDAVHIPDNFNVAADKMAMSAFLKEVLTKSGKWYTEDSFLDKKPGSFYEYSNVGATLAAAVLEYAIGESYDAFTTKHILQPLKMNASGWSFETVDMAMHSTQYLNPKTVLAKYSLITYPDGGLITSSNDLGLYLSELIKGYSGEGTILNDKSYKTLFTQQLDASHFEERDTDNPYDDEYNSGIFMGFSPQGNIGHTGGDPGVSSFMFFDSKSKVGRILIINTDLNSQEGVNAVFSIMDKMKLYED